MKVLVIGATGFIGRHLVDRLLAGGHTVRALVRGPESAVDLRRQGVELLPGDVCDPDSVTRAAEGMEVIYNLAGASDTVLGRSDHYGDRIFETNCLGNINAARAALSTGARRLVTVSSVFIFGHSPGKPVDEEYAPNLWRYAGPYLLSRLQQEMHVLRYALRGIEVIIVNPGFIVGPKDRGPNFPGGIVLAYLNRRIIACPPGGTSWIGVSDVAEGLMAAATKGRSGERYIFTSEDITFRELGERIERLTGVPAPKLILPATVLKAGASVGSVIADMFGKRPAIDPRVGARLMADGFYYSSAKAVLELGLPTNPIDNDLLAACEDFKRRGLARYK